MNLAKEGKSKGGGSLVEVVPGGTTLRLQYEKKGRGGKGVTLVLDLPHNPPYFKRLMKEIKTQLGVGGAFKDAATGDPAHLEFQGNCTERVQILLKEKGFTVKG